VFTQAFDQECPHSHHEPVLKPNSLVCVYVHTPAVLTPLASLSKNPARQLPHAWGTECVIVIHKQSHHDQFLALNSIFCTCFPHPRSPNALGKLVLGSSTPANARVGGRVRACAVLGYGGLHTCHHGRIDQVILPSSRKGRSFLDLVQLCVHGHDGLHTHHHGKLIGKRCIWQLMSHIFTHTHTHTHTHSPFKTHPYTLTHTHTHAHILTCTHTHTLTHTHPSTHTLTHSHTHTNAHTLTCTHTHTHTRTHAYTQVCTSHTSCTH